MDGDDDGNNHAAASAADVGSGSAGAARDGGGGGEGESSSLHFNEGYTPLGFDMNALAAMDGSDSDGDAAAEDGQMDGELFATEYYHMMGAPPKRWNGVKDGVHGLAMHHREYDGEGASAHADDSNEGHARSDDDEASAEAVDVPDDFHRLAEQALRGLEVERLSVLDRTRVTPMDAPIPIATADAPAENAAQGADAPTERNNAPAVANFAATFPNFDAKDGASGAPDDTQSASQTTEEAAAPLQKKTTAALPKVQLKEPTSKSMDVGAVQKAMQSIRLKSPQLATALDAGASSSFSTKTAHAASDAALNAVINSTCQAVEESRLRQLTNHAIIPSGPLAAFRRSTPKAQAASANLSRSATLSEAVLRLWPLIFFRRRSRAMGLGGKTAQQQRGCSKTLTIHILGADGVECSSEETVRKSVGSFVRWLDAALHSGALSRDGSQSTDIDSLLIQFSGPCMPTALAGKEMDLLHEGSALASATATFLLGEYHEAPSSARDGVDDADIAIAFNAGIWGYDSWKPTLAHMCTPTVKSSAGNASWTECSLFVITAYTVEECEDDAEVVEKVASERALTHPIARQLWAPEPNPFRSRLERKTASAPPGRKYYENGAWQAWLLGM